MKKILLDSNKTFYKANLHCHSILSDGKKTPEELKAMYMEKGYSIIAYTDHDILLDHSDLNDEAFLALNGYEMEITEDGDDFDLCKTCHMCLIALEPENLTQVCYHRNNYIFGNAQNYKEMIKYDTSKADYEREYTPECINDMISQGRENGFFVTYNHPAWSMETLENYGKYQGMNAMEICNYGCMAHGFDDYNPKEYDSFLRRGQKIFCIATDDNHNHEEDSFGGFTMINAEKLSYRVITSALEAGNFYASQGPLIKELWYEDGKMGITCSEAVMITLSTGNRKMQVRYQEEGSALTSAIFDIKNEYDYVRITVKDAYGKYANTNAYFVEDL